MLVSVIIAVRNEQRYLSACLDSVLAQTHIPLEILVVDGMSTDRSPAILAEYARGHDRVRLFANPGLRAGCAFNIGIRHARGEVIIILGAHTKVAPDFVAANLRVLDRTGADIVGGVIETRGVGYMGTAIALVLSSRFGTGTNFRCARKAGDVDTVAFGAYRAGIFRELGPFLETIPGDHDIAFNAEDLEFNHRAVRAGKRIYMDPDIRPVYFCRTNLATLVRKNIKTGRVVMAMLLDRPNSVSIRHMVPSLFCGTLLIFAALSLVLRPFLWLLLLQALLYVSGVVGASLVLSLKGGLTYLPAIILAFPVHHLSYGMAGLYQLCLRGVGLLFRCGRKPLPPRSISTPRDGPERDPGAT